MPDTSPSSVARIGIVGDLHGCWGDADSHYFNRAGYDLLLFTGDLGSGMRNNGPRIARSLARLEKPTLVMPGNNDTAVAPQIAAELAHQRGLFSLLGLGRVTEQTAGRVHLCGYSLHPFLLGGRQITVLAGRPYSTGGGEIASAAGLLASYGVTSLADSSRKLCELVDAVTHEDLIVLAHNGPAGLGSEATDIWGRDFGGEAGDWGDSDLTAAIEHAKARQLRVLAVVAGHMHTWTRDGRARTWQVRDGNTLYLNASRVPRIFERAGGLLRHHIALELEGATATAREILVSEPG